MHKWMLFFFCIYSLYSHHISTCITGKMILVCMSNNKEQKMKNIHEWATIVGICPWFTKSILFNLKQQSTFSGNSSAFCAYIHKHHHNHPPLLLSFSCHLFLNIQIKKSQLLPEWLSQDSESHFSYAHEMLLIPSLLCN